MARTTIRVELNRQGIGELARGPELAADIGRRGNAVAAAANPPLTADDEPVPIRSEVRMGRTRVRARVIADHPGALPLEARDRYLARALDAAGG